MDVSKTSGFHKANITGDKENVRKAGNIFAQILKAARRVPAEYQQYVEQIRRDDGGDGPRPRFRFKIPSCLSFLAHDEAAALIFPLNPPRLVKSGDAVMEYCEGDAPWVLSSSD